MTLQDLIAATRQRLNDLARPLLWSDDELTMFLNEAQNEACIRAQLLIDVSEPGICEIDVTVGEHTYDLDPRILTIRRAKLDLADRPLIETSMEALDEAGASWFPSYTFPAGAQFYPGGSNWEILTGNPERFIQIGDAQIRLIRIPIAADTLRLRVTRLPLEPMKNERCEPEISPKYHYRLIDWAERCAYLKKDSQTFDPNAALKAETAFTASFGVRPDANVARKRRDDRPKAVRMGVW